MKKYISLLLFTCLSLVGFAQLQTVSIAPDSIAVENDSIRVFGTVSIGGQPIQVVFSQPIDVTVDSVTVRNFPDTLIVRAFNNNGDTVRVLNLNNVNAGVDTVFVENEVFVDFNRPVQVTGSVGVFDVELNSCCFVSPANDTIFGVAERTYSNGVLVTTHFFDETGVQFLNATEIPCNNTHEIEVCDTLTINHTLGITANVGGSALNTAGVFTAGVDFPTGETDMTWFMSGITDPNDPSTIQQWDLSNGFAPFGTTVFADYSDYCDGSYNAILLSTYQSGNSFGSGAAVLITNGEITTVSIGGDAPLSWQIAVNKGLQKYDSYNRPLGNPFDPITGLEITPQGAFTFNCPPLAVDFVSNYEFSKFTCSTRKDTVINEGIADVELTKPCCFVVASDTLYGTVEYTYLDGAIDNKRFIDQQGNEFASATEIDCNYSHEAVVCDTIIVNHAINVQATVGGTPLTAAGIYIAGTDFPTGQLDIAWSTANIVDPRDTLSLVQWDFGNGRRVLGETPTFNYSRYCDGTYEAVQIFITESKNSFGNGAGVVISNGEIFAVVIPDTVFIDWGVKVNEALQKYDSFNRPIGNPFDPTNGQEVTAEGGFTIKCNMRVNDFAQTFSFSQDVCGIVTLDSANTRDIELVYDVCAINTSTNDTIRNGILQYTYNTVGDLISTRYITPDQTSTLLQDITIIDCGGDDSRIFQGFEITIPTVTTTVVAPPSPCKSLSIVCEDTDATDDIIIDITFSELVNGNRRIFLDRDARGYSVQYERTHISSISIDNSDQTGSVRCNVVFTNE